MAGYLQRPPLVHHRHPGGHGHRLDLVVGDIDDGGRDLAVQAEISVRISTRRRASSADNGSSINSTFGSLMIARPMATRCCWPPESCPGFMASLSLRPGSRHFLHLLVHPGAGKASNAQRIADVLAHRHVRKQRDVLEHHGDIALLRGQCGDVGVAEPDAPGVGVSRPAIIRSVVVLPQPEGPRR